MKVVFPAVKAVCVATAIKKNPPGWLLTAFYAWGFFCLNGCAAVVKQQPPPPAPPARFELNGPYDRDIPEKLAGQLRGAGSALDWTIPYLLLNVALQFESRGDGTRALHFYDRAIGEFRARKDLAGEGTATSRKIFALSEFGDARAAFDLIGNREKVWNGSSMQAFVDYGYGHYYLRSGDYPRALDYFRRALDGNANSRGDFNRLMLGRDTELAYGIAVILADYVPRMSRKHSLIEFDPVMFAAIQKNLDEGAAHLNRALALNKAGRRAKAARFLPERVFQVAEADAYNFLGLADCLRGRGDEARRHLSMSLEIARRAGYRIGEIDGIFFTNQLWLLEKNVTEGAKAAELLSETADRYGFPFYQVWGKFILARYVAGFGDNTRAADLLREAVAVSEKQQAGLGSDLLKETDLFNRQVVYEAFMELLAREGDYAGALEIAERVKSRVLVDLLAGKDIGRNPAETALLQEERKVSGEIDGLRKQLARTQGQQNGALVARMEKDEEAYRALVLRLKKENEELSSLVSLQSTPPAEIQALLDDDTTLFDYYVTDNLLYVWAVTRERVHLERIKITREELRNLVESFRAAINGREKRATSQLSQKIYDLILKPIIPFVSGDRIGFVPHDSLYYLPFAALSYKGRYLVDGFALFQLPDAAVLKYALMRKTPSELRVLAVGNPDPGDKAPESQELETVRRKVEQTTVLMGKDATRARLTAMLADHEALHVAARGRLVPDAPLNSCLLLAPDGRDDGRLSALDIFRLSFSGRFVVMSACQTALGASSTGDEIVGLTRSLLYAGSPSVVSTLWNGADKETASLMEDFYQAIEQGKDVAGSLQAAQLSMIRKGYAPYYWATYVLTGRY